MMSGLSSLILLNSEAARSFRLDDVNVSWWLHMKKGWDESSYEIISNLTRSASVHFTVSGVDAMLVHDRIDDIAFDRGFEPTTTWHEGALNEVVWDFLNVDYSSKTITIRCIVVLGESSISELETLSDLISLIAEVAKDEEIRNFSGPLS
jgi:hypothetical protein